MGGGNTQGLFFRCLEPLLLLGLLFLAANKHPKLLASLSPPRVVVVVAAALFWASPDLIDLLSDRKFTHDRRSATHHRASDQGASMDRFPLSAAGK